jgi:CBS domain-containing protein
MLDANPSHQEDEPMLVRDVMSTAVVSATPAMPLLDLAALLAEREISGVPVVDETGAVIGVVSEGDLLMKQLGAAQPERGLFHSVFRPLLSGDELRRRAATSVREAMTSPAITIEANRPVRDAATLMVERNVNRLPVIEDGQLVGMLTRADLVHAYLQRDDDVLRTVRRRVLRDAMWLEPDAYDVKVRDGAVTIAGTVDRRSTASIIGKLIGVVDGVVRVDNKLAWEWDDTSVAPAADGEREPGAASLTARDRPRSQHR